MKKGKKSTGPTFYAVHVGKQPGVYTNWDDTKKQVLGISKAVYRKFTNRDEAEAFVAIGPASTTSTTKPQAMKRLGPGGSTPTLWVVTTPDLPPGESRISPGSVRPKKKMKTCDNGGDEEKERNDNDAEDGNGYHEDIDLPIVEEARDSEHDALLKTIQSPHRIIYADGACLDNGTGEADAGYGVYFGPGNRLNRNGSVPGAQTNQRAELCAIAATLNVLASLGWQDPAVTIFTDSKYAIRNLTVNYKRWLLNGWMTTEGTRVKNRDLMEPMLQILHVDHKEVRLAYVKGHAGVAGNEAADQLARSAAQKARSLRQQQSKS